MSTVTSSGRAARTARLSSAQVWRELSAASFAVISYVTPLGEPRSSGVIYAVDGIHMYVVSAADSWKARHIPATDEVAVTVPVRRGGILSLVAPIPPATISFHGRAVVRPVGTLGDTVPAKVAALLPPERREMCRVIQIRPMGDFLTYGIRVPLLKMRHPELSRARVAVDGSLPARSRR